jgi:hypothetical protein
MVATTANKGFQSGQNWPSGPTKAGKTFAPSTHSTKSNIACMHICSDDNVLNQKLKINIIKFCFLICSSFF